MSATDGHIVVDGGQLFLHWNHAKKQLKVVFCVPGKKSEWDKKGEATFDLRPQIPAIVRGTQLATFLTVHGQIKYQGDVLAKMKEMSS